MLSIHSKGSLDGDTDGTDLGGLTLNEQEHGWRGIVRIYARSIATVSKDVHVYRSKIVPSIYSYMTLFIVSSKKAHKSINLKFQKLYRPGKKSSHDLPNLQECAFEKIGIALRYVLLTFARFLNNHLYTQ